MASQLRGSPIHSEEQVSDAIRRAGEYLGYKEVKDLQIKVSLCAMHRLMGKDSFGKSQSI